MRRVCGAVILVLGLSLLSAPAALAQSVALAPLGPSAPAGGWSLEYGDAFGDPICGAPDAVGRACDNTLFPNRNAGGCSPTPGYNSDEMEQFACSQVSVGPDGLALSCTPSLALRTPAGHVPATFLCGAVQGQDTSVPRGFRFFRWTPGRGQEWAIQLVAQLPPNTGEADPAWWSSDWADTEEIDFLEGFGLQAGRGGGWCSVGAEPNANGYIGITLPTWIYDTASGASVQAENSLCSQMGFDPSAGLHTYTTVFFPNRTFAEYVDGKPDAWSYLSDGAAGQTVAGPPPSISDATMGLILSYGLRADATGDPDLYFLGGTRSFLIRSVAVYENATADGAYAYNVGLAPGTSLIGGQSRKEGWPTWLRLRYSSRSCGFRGHRCQARRRHKRH
jgi:hypothetical protein